MCAIFGAISNKVVNKTKFNKLVKHSRQRGVDSSGIIYLKDGGYRVKRADFQIQKLLNRAKPYSSNIILGHSRLITNGLSDNQPVVRKNICAIHNGIIVNEDEI